MPRERYSTTVHGFRILGDGFKANAADFQHMEKHIQKLAEITKKAELLVAQRNALEAESQRLTRELQSDLPEARRLCSLLRAAARLHYGTRSEKLVEFGMRPFRGRSRSRAKRQTEE